MDVDLSLKKKQMQIYWILFHLSTFLTFFILSDKKKVEMTVKVETTFHVKK